MVRTDTTEPIFEIDSLQVKFEQHEVLRAVNLTIGRGETIAVIGESGCGKTVLLKNLIGLIRPTQGKVCFDRLDLEELSEKALTEVRVRMGFLFQNAALFDSMTVGQNVAFPLRQHTRMSDVEVRGLQEAG